MSSINKKYLLITSDDFGISHSVNQGILQGFQRGLLQSSNFMAAAPWLPEAIRLTKQHNLPIGVHLTLTCEWTNMACSPITNAPSITDPHGYFHRDYDAFLSTMDIEEIKNEYRAQIQRVIQNGIQPTHVETHMLPALLFAGGERYEPIAQAVEEVANEFGLIYTYATENGKLKYFDHALELTHVSYSDLVARLSSLPAGIYHLICHCGLDTSEQRSLAQEDEPVHRWAAKARQDDLDIVTSEAFKRFLEQHDFELIDIARLLELVT